MLLCGLGWKGVYHHQSARSPVVMTLKSDRPPERNQPVEFTLTLSTANGKPIGPADLLDEGRLVELITDRLIEQLNREGARHITQVSRAAREAIARAAELNERYVREWLGAMATAGIVEYEPGRGAFMLPPFPRYARCLGGLTWQHLASLRIRSSWACSRRSGVTPAVATARSRARTASASRCSGWSASR